MANRGAVELAFLPRDRVDHRPIVLTGGGDADIRKADRRIIAEPVLQRAASDHHAKIGPAERAREFGRQHMIAIALGIDRDLADEGGLVLPRAGRAEILRGANGLARIEGRADGGIDRA